MPLSNVFEINKPPPPHPGGGVMEDLRYLLINRAGALNILLFKLVLFFSLTDSNVTLVPPTPNPPLLLSSEYLEFTLQWTEYSQLYNDSPVIFVLEVKRHENISDPASFLPVIKKYHTVSILASVCVVPRGRTTEQNFIVGVSALRSNSIPFYIPFLTETVPHSYLPLKNDTPLTYLRNTNKSRSNMKFSCHLIFV